MINIFNTFTNTNNAINERGIDTLTPKKRADSLNAKYNRFTVPPIISEKIIQSEGLSQGLTVERKSFHDSIVASLERSKRTIYLTDDSILFNKWGNFALAHELGHWLLDNNEEDFFDPSKLLNDKNNTEDDIKANYFALYLLIPDKFMRQYAWLDSPVFASAFRVPQEALIKRKSLQ